MAFACVFENRLLQNFMVNVNRLITIFPIRTPFWRYTTIFRHIWVSSVTTLAHRQNCAGSYCRSPMGVIPVELFGWCLDIRIYLMLTFFLTYYIYIYIYIYIDIHVNIHKYVNIPIIYRNYAYLHLLNTAGRVCICRRSKFCRADLPGSRRVIFVNWLLLIWKYLVANYPRIVFVGYNPSDFSGLTLQKSHVNHWVVH